MQTHRTIIGSAAWNFLGVICEVGRGFLTARFLIRHLGETSYGLWIVLGSLASQFLLLDLGVRGSIGRFIALHRGKEDPRAINETLTGGIAVLAVAAMLAVLATVALLPLLLDLIEVPADQLENTRIALFIVGLNLSAALVLNSFDATLWGFQRFDLTNGIDIPTIVLRTAAIFYFVGSGGIVSLAWITLASTSINGLLKAVTSFAVIPGLRISPAYLNASAIRELLAYSIWRFVCSVSDIVRTQLTPILIGSLLGLAQVTFFAIAARLTFHVRGIIEAVTGVAAPSAAVLHARGDQERQRQLLIWGTSACLSLSLYFATLFFLLGEPLIVLWIGPALAPAAGLLSILAAGEILPQSQQVATGLLFASARHRLLAFLNLAEISAIAFLMLLLAGPLGLRGCCLAIAISATLYRGAAVAMLSCWALDLSLVRYFAQTVPSSLLRATPPALLLALLTLANVPGSWGQLILYGSLYTAACGVVFLLLAQYQFHISYGDLLSFRPWAKTVPSPDIEIAKDAVAADCVKPGT